MRGARGDRIRVGVRWAIRRGRPRSCGRSTSRTPWPSWRAFSASSASTRSATGSSSSDRTSVQLTLDVAARTRRFGVAYITWQDADKLGDDLPKRADPDAIIVVHGSGADDDVHAALLFAADYMQDDLSGEQHTSTAIAAEQKLELATRDVLRRAEHENWP